MATNKKRKGLKGVYTMPVRNTNFKIMSIDGNTHGEIQEEHFDDFESRKIKSLAIAESFGRIAEEAKKLYWRFYENTNPFAIDSNIDSGYKTTDTEQIRLRYANYADSMKECGTILGFNKNRQLCAANFCRLRLCPMCEWRRSKATFSQLSTIIEHMGKQGKIHTALLVTLTVKNCSGDRLKDTIEMVLKGWSNLIKNNRLKDKFKGWFRVLELTYNEKTGFHPHIHAIFLPAEDYFKNSNYLQNIELAHIWKSACMLNYVPSTNIKKIKMQKDDKWRVIKEVAKYTIKSSDIISQNYDKMDYLVEILHNALYRKRLQAYGGSMRKAYQELNIKDIDSHSLLDISDDEKVHEDIWQILEVWHWNYNTMRYKVSKPITGDKQ